jgi:mannose-1-phosphate guanylyltransferase
VRAVVLVGGEGTRLRPLTLTTPKQMLPIVEQPMIERVIGHLADHGIDDAVLSLGYRPDAFINAYPSGTIAGVRLTYAVEPTPLDTAGRHPLRRPPRRHRRHLRGINGDVLTDADLSALIDFHRLRGAEATISLTPVDDPSAFGVVPTDDEGRVEAFIEKPPRDEAPTNLINAGTYVFEPSVLDRIPPTAGCRSSGRPSRPWSRPGQALRARLGRLLAGHRHARRLPAGPPRPAAGPAPGSPRTFGAELDPSIGPGVWRIGRGGRQERLGGPVPARDGASVAAGAVVEESVIGAGAMVEEGASVTGSVLLPGARVASKATVEGSVIGPGAIVGQRCVIHGSR